MAYGVRDRFGQPVSVCRVLENLLNSKPVRDRSGPVRRSQKRPPKRSFTTFRVAVRALRRVLERIFPKCPAAPDGDIFGPRDGF